MQMKGFFTMCMFTNFTQINWMMQIFTFINLLYPHHSREKK